MKKVLTVILSVVVLVCYGLFAMASGRSSRSRRNPTTDATTTTETNTGTTTTSEVTTEATTVETIDKDAFIESCIDMDYKDIARNPDDYIGQNFYAVVYVSSAREGGLFTGYQKYYVTYVFDIDEAEDYIDREWADSLSDTGLLACDTDKPIWLLDNRSEEDADYIKILETDVIIVYGTFNGLQETKNALTGETGEEVALDIKYVEILD